MRQEEIIALFEKFGKNNNIPPEEVKMLIQAFFESTIEEQKIALEQISAQTASATPTAKYGLKTYQQGGQASEMEQMQQIQQMIAQMLQQGIPPEEIVAQLVEQGIPEELVVQILQALLSGMSEEEQTAKFGGCFKCGGKVKSYQFGGQQEDPVQKVFALIDDMEAKGKKPKEIAAALVKLGIPKNKLKPLLEAYAQQKQQVQPQTLMPMMQQGGDPMQQVMQMVMQMLQEGAQPEEIIQQLIQMGIPEDQAMQIVEMILSQSQQMSPAQMPVQMPMAKYGLKRRQMGGQQDPMEQIMQVVMQMLQNGMSPEEIVQQLVQMGIPEEQAVQIIQMIMQQQGGQPMMKYGGIPYAQIGMSVGEPVKIDNNTNPFSFSQTNNPYQPQYGTMQDYKAFNEAIKNTGFNRREESQMLRQNTKDFMPDVDPLSMAGSIASGATDAITKALASVNSTRTDSKGRLHTSKGGHIASTAGKTGQTVGQMTSFVKDIPLVGGLAHAGITAVATGLGAIAGNLQAKTKIGYENIAYGTEDVQNRNIKTQLTNSLGSDLPGSEYGSMVKSPGQQSVLDKYYKFKSMKNGGKV